MIKMIQRAIMKQINKYLTENLRVEVKQKAEFGPCEGVTVKLSLDGVIISEDDCYLPVGE